MSDNERPAKISRKNNGKCDFFPQDRADSKLADVNNYIYNWTYSVDHHSFPSEHRPARDCRILIEFSPYANAITDDSQKANFRMWSNHALHDQIESCELVVFSGKYFFSNSYNVDKDYTRENCELSFLKKLKQIDLVIEMDDADYDMDKIDFSKLFCDINISTIIHDADIGVNRICHALRRWLANDKRQFAFDRRSDGYDFFNRFLSKADNITSLNYETNRHRFNRYGSKLHKKSRLDLWFCVEYYKHREDVMDEWREILKIVKNSVEIRDLTVYGLNTRNAWVVLLDGINHHKYINRLHIGTDNFEDTLGIMRYMEDEGYEIPNLKILTFDHMEEGEKNLPSKLRGVMKQYMHQILLNNHYLLAVLVYNRMQLLVNLNNIISVKNRIINENNQNNELIIWLNSSSVFIPYDVIDKLVLFLESQKTAYSLFLQ